MSTDTLKKLSALGQSLWYDNIERGRPTDVAQMGRVEKKFHT